MKKESQRFLNRSLFPWRSTTPQKPETGSVNEPTDNPKPPFLAMDLEKFFNPLIRWRWLFPVTLLLAYLTFEFYEHPNAIANKDPFFIREILLVSLLFLIIIIIFEMLLKVLADRRFVTHKLNIRHQLSLQLALTQDQYELATVVINFLRTITPLSGANLYVYDPEVEKYWIAAHWSDQSLDPSNIPLVCELDKCQVCMINNPFIVHAIDSNCGFIPYIPTEHNSKGYCLTLSYGNVPKALIHLFLLPNTSLDDKQIDLVQNIGYEIAVALEASIQQIKSKEQAFIQAADAERRIISRDLHDTIGQNISYLHLKLDHLAKNEALSTLEGIRSDLEQMRDVANDSYELIRGTLETLYPENSLNLVDVLSSHSQLVAERANLAIGFTSEGESRPLDREALRHLFYIYQEALSNIEKHAQARHVKTYLMWGKDSLTLKISDDGQGFIPDLVRTDQHFGLTFMRQRVKELNGTLTLHSEEKSGTQLTIWLPFKIEAVR